MANEKQRVVTTRAGGKWEAIGFLLIVIGLLAPLFLGLPMGIGVGSFIVGVIVFLIGRFK